MAALTLRKGQNRLNLVVLAQLNVYGAKSSNIEQKWNFGQKGLKLV